MNDSDFSEDDEILGALVIELSKVTDDSAKQQIVQRYIAKYPHLKERILQLAGMNKVMEQAQQSAEIPELPREFGEFVVVRRIDRAGMGEIYEAYHERLDRRVAIKIIRRGWTSPKAKQSFDREQLVLAKLHQTHIVPIHTAGEHDGVQYFVMPYIEGASLNFVVQAAREHHSTRSEQNTPSVGRFAEHAVSLMKSGISETLYRSDSEKAAPGSGIHGNGAEPELTLPIPFSKEYHSSVARAIADVADAVGYAHAAGILHGDLKPHNIMIEPNGHVWVIDFGLAGFLKRESDAARVADVDSDGAETVPSIDKHPQLTRGVAGGTPSYMAPERWDGGKATEQSDVWALGATLYELLTLHQAFKGPGEKKIRQQILEQAAKAPKEFVKSIPADLAAICSKAMDRDPSQRYQFAADLATDLRRWLNHEPTTALPAQAPRRAALWCRRNPGWASLIGALVVMAIVFGGMEARVIAAKEKEIEAKNAAIKADAKVIVAIDQEIKIRDHLLAIRDIERIQSSTHAKGWSEQIWNDGASLEVEADVRDALATSLIDMDAEEIYDDKTTTADFLAFDEFGERLVGGGSTDDDGTLGQLPKVLDLKTRTWHESTIKGSGPVAFRKDGVPVVLVPDPENARRVQLFDVKTSQEITSFITDGPAVKLTNENRPILALSPDASFAVIATLSENSDGKTREFEISVWNTSTSERIHQCRVEGASSLAITPDGKVLAVGQLNGQIGLWSSGKPVRFADLLHRHAVLSLAFASDYLRRLPVVGEAVPGTGWLLASGDNAGSSIVWDVTQRQPRTFIRGSYYETSSLAFSHDASLLFSAGRSPAHVWDVATGEQILTWDQSDYMPGLAITQSGMIASSGVELFGRLPGVKIQRLRHDRGGIVLRGLRDVGRRLSISHDGSLIAGLTITWQVGVWRTDGTLLHVFEAPVAPFADNATIAFSPDNRELFCCTGDVALTWNLGTGTVARTWPVAPALVNESAYSPDGQHLYLARKEVIDCSRYPLSDAPAVRYPRIFRAYDLLSDGGGETPILELKGFAERTYRAQVGSNGLLILAGDSLPKGPNPAERTSQRECWDLLTRQRLWSNPDDSSSNSLIDLSHQGKSLVLTQNLAGGSLEIVDPRSGVAVKAAQSIGFCDDNRRFSALRAKNTPESSDDRYVVLYAAGEPDPLVSFFFEASHAFEGEFLEYQNRTHLAWVNDKGHIVVIDLEKIRSRLESVGLGWKLPKP